MLTNTTNQQQIAVIPVTYQNYTLLANEALLYAIMLMSVQRHQMYSKVKVQTQRIAVPSSPLLLTTLLPLLVVVEVVVVVSSTSIYNFLFIY